VALRLLGTVLSEWTVKVPLSKPQSRQELAREVLAYFLRNPKGADDLKGITKWRLLDQVIHRALEETSDALEWLVSEGYLAVESTAGSERIFRLNKEKREEAVHFMSGNESTNHSLE
jgi:hypothetical protein